jgi:YggT family protein
MIELLSFISYLLDLFIYIIIAGAIMSWLLALGALNFHNNMVRSIWHSLQAVTEPVLKPIRRALPATGALDLSPLVLILAIMFVQRVILPNIAKAL